MVAAVNLVVAEVNLAVAADGAVVEILAAALVVVVNSAVAALVAEAAGAALAPKGWKVLVGAAGAAGAAVLKRAVLVAAADSAWIRENLNAAAIVTSRIAIVAKKTVSATWNACKNVCRNRPSAACDS